MNGTGIAGVAPEARSSPSSTAAGHCFVDAVAGALRHAGDNCRPMSSTSARSRSTCAAVPQPRWGAPATRRALWPSTPMTAASSSSAPADRGVGADLSRPSRGDRVGARAFLGRWSSGRRRVPCRPDRAAPASSSCPPPGRRSSPPTWRPALATSSLPAASMTPPHAGSRTRCSGPIPTMRPTAVWARLRRLRRQPAGPHGGRRRPALHLPQRHGPYAAGVAALVERHPTGARARSLWRLRTSGPTRPCPALRTKASGVGGSVPASPCRACRGGSRFGRCRPRRVGLASWPGSAATPPRRRGGLPASPARNITPRTPVRVFRGSGAPGEAVALDPAFGVGGVEKCVDGSAFPAGWIVITVSVAAGSGAAAGHSALFLVELIEVVGFGGVRGPVETSRDRGSLITRR